MIPHPTAGPSRAKTGSGDPPDAGTTGQITERTVADQRSEPISAGPSSAQTASTEASQPAPVASPGSDRSDVSTPSDNGGVDLARLAWLVTVLACVITIAILAVEGYYGYALVTLAVALSAGINLM
jgi:hypothetical protein